MKWTSFLVSCLFIQNVRSETKNLKIIHGIPVLAPYQAVVSVMLPEGEKLCGGSLIRKNYILTAAHCFDRQDKISATVVVLGTHDLNSDDGLFLEIPKKDIIIHPNYSDKNKNINDDIALMHLSTDVELNDVIQLIQLQESNENLSGKTAQATGFGQTNDQEGNSSKILLGVNLTIIGNDLCALGYKKILDTQICTIGKEKKSPCKGDSGGPVVDVETGLQVGIISFGTNYCEIGWPTVHTRISKYIDWINENLS